MNKAGPMAEPSMEEILASIRRIISDGEEQQDGAGDTGAAGFGSRGSGRADQPAPALREVGARSERDGEGETGISPRKPASGEPDDADDILELTEEMFAPEPSAAKKPDEPADIADSAPRPSADDGPGAADATPDEARADVDDVVVDEAEVSMPTVEARAPDVAFAEAPAAKAAAAPASKAEQTTHASPRAPAEAAAETARPSEPQAPAEAAEAAVGAEAMREALVSPATNAAVASAFGKLANTILSQDPRTLEDLVKEMLRPMLREWLDDNLPPLVERLVRAEIERVSRGS